MDKEEILKDELFYMAEMIWHLELSIMRNKGYAKINGIDLLEDPDHRYQSGCLAAYKQVLGRFMGKLHNSEEIMNIIQARLIPEKELKI